MKTTKRDTRPGTNTRERNRHRNQHTRGRNQNTTQEPVPSKRNSRPISAVSEAMEKTRYRDQSCELGASNKSSAIPKLGKLVDRRQKRLLFACRNSHRTPARLDARIFMRMGRFKVMSSSRGDCRCVRCRKLPLRRSKTKLFPCRRYAGLWWYLPLD